MLMGHAKLNISTAYPRTLGIILVHKFCLESPPTCFDSNALTPSVYPNWLLMCHPKAAVSDITLIYLLIKPCQFRLQIWLNSMSSPLNVFSDITLKCFCLKKASFENTVITKAQKILNGAWKTLYASSSPANFLRTVSSIPLLGQLSYCMSF